MDTNVYLEIENAESVIAFLTEAKKAGMLIGVSMYKTKQQLAQASFPIRIPVKLEAILALTANPMVKKFMGKSVEKKAEDILTAALGAGR